MQRLPGKLPQHCGKLVVRDLPPERLSVDRIPDNRPSSRGEMHANLVRAPGDQSTAEQRQPDSLRRERSRFARTASCCVRQESATPATLRRSEEITPKAQIDLSTRRGDTPIHQREVVLRRARGSPFALHRRVYGGRFRDEDEAGREFVEPADNRRP